MVANDFGIELYADGADLNNIVEFRRNPIVKGFTTNPTLMRVAGVKDYLDFCIQAVEVANPYPISLEVFEDDFAEMERQAHKLAALGPNVFVKIPIMNTRSEDSFDLIRNLNSSGISLNVTAVFTKRQIDAVLACTTDACPVILSIFAGRIADTGVDPVAIIKYAVEMSSDRSKLRVLWASPREIFNLVQAEYSGAHIITMTSDLWKKLPLIGKDLEQYSLETVKMFHEDARLSGFDF